MQGLQGRSDMIMTFGVCCHAAKSALDELETTEFSFGQTKIGRVAIIQFGMNPSAVAIGDAVSNQDEGHECNT